MSRSIGTALLLLLCSHTLLAADAGWTRQSQTASDGLTLDRAQARFAALSGQWQQLPARRDDAVIRVYALQTMGLAEAALALAQQLPAGARDAGMQLMLAESLYEQGRFAAARNLLQTMDQDTRPAVELARNELLTRIGIRLRNYDDAALPLAASQTRMTLAPIQRYNLGVAWLGAGADARGASELNEIGIAPATDQAADTANPYLADRANLMLGYWLLDQSRNAAAAAVLRRVRLESPVAAQAMLGLGWAEFNSDQAGQPLEQSSRRDCESVDPALWREIGALHSTSRVHCEVRQQNGAPALGGMDGYAGAENGFRRAAVLWQTLTQGDARNVVVAEALANLPHALARAGDRHAAQLSGQQAARRIQQAIRQLEDGHDVALPDAADPRQLHLADELAFVNEAGERIRRRIEMPDPLFQAVAGVLAQQRGDSTRPKLQPAQRGLLKYFLSLRDLRRPVTREALPQDMRARRDALLGQLATLKKDIRRVSSRIGSQSRSERVKALQRYEAGVRVFLAELQSRS